MNRDIDVSNKVDVIDSSDIQERIKYLEDDIEYQNLEEDKNELEILNKLEKDIIDCVGAEYEYGVQLIRDSYFEEYAQELAEDIGLIKRDVSWPYTCIDWEQAAHELKYDYSIVEYDGIDYWVRSC